MTSSPELIRTRFIRTSKSTPLTCQRGVYGVPGTGSFQWTAGVKALCALLARFSEGQQLRTPLETAYIEGAAGSLAASFDYALSKAPLWLIDMFGAESNGLPYARRLFFRQNPERKLPGPVRISISKSSWDMEVLCYDHQDTPLTVAQLRLLQATLGTPKHEMGYKRGNAARAQVTTSSKTLINPFADLLFREAVHGLSATPVFTPGAIRSYVEFLRSCDYGSIAGVDPGVLAEFESSLPPSHFLGIPSAPTAMEQTLRGEERLRVLVPPPLIGSLCIFQHMKAAKQYQIDPDFSTTVTHEIITRLVRGAFHDLPAAIVLTVASAGSFLARRRLPYRPLTFLPAQSHRLLSAPATRAKHHSSKSRLPGMDYVWSESPTSASFYLDDLVRTKLLNKGRFQVRHAEASTALQALASGDEEVRTIQPFPFYALDELYTKASPLLGPTGPASKPIVMFLHERYFTDERAVHVAVAVRNAWLELLEDRARVKSACDHYAGDQGYLALIGRSAGLYHINAALHTSTG